jgi:hypothetical protein
MKVGRRGRHIAGLQGRSIFLCHRGHALNAGLAQVGGNPKRFDEVPRAIGSLFADAQGDGNIAAIELARRRRRG